ncbi:molybdenum cofactor biosynthesis protein MoaE [Micromonospora sp. NBRC 107095]|uniref:molybdenum cofactor biosynthesis protein MoaE n=1 Tax=Micromonospora sp. NBRC 107095 TaxID=3032209 RepID=UPI0024A343C6|nr:molybdenum cofactor biosynthesis protein MoaE [Micromonospora sp. NBRC 107095]GLZ60909.1 molybdopterin synthase sulfur carrier subunit [Micromonospora sp. NBRC 107095]
MNIDALYFGVIREQICKRPRETFDDLRAPTVEEFLVQLTYKYPDLQKLRGRLRVAVNEEFVDLNHVLSHGDEVVLIPPVAGGAGKYCRLVTHALDIGEVIAAVTAPDHGNVTTSTCFVRNISHSGKLTVRLEFEAYPSMAIQKLGTIIDRCEAMADNVRVAIAIRTGVLNVGEIIRVVAVGAPSLRTAHDILGSCMEAMRADIPIWKKEIGPTDGEWVNAAGIPVFNQTP